MKREGGGGRKGKEGEGKKGNEGNKGDWGNRAGAEKSAAAFLFSACFFILVVKCAHLMEMMWQYPRNDFGDNYFLFIRLPGELCMERGDSAERVEKAMEEVDPNIWNKAFDEASASWDQVLYRALRDILKWNIP